MHIFWDLLCQLMQHGTNTLHVAFIFLFNIVWVEKEISNAIGQVSLLRTSKTSLTSPAHFRQIKVWKCPFLEQSLHHLVASRMFMKAMRRITCNLQRRTGSISYFSLLTGGENAPKISSFAPFRPNLHVSYQRLQSIHVTVPKVTRRNEKISTVHSHKHATSSEV